MPTLRKKLSRPVHYKILLLTVEGYKQREIAERLGVSYSTVQGIVECEAGKEWLREYSRELEKRLQKVMVMQAAEKANVLPNLSSKTRKR